MDSVLGAVGDSWRKVNDARVGTVSAHWVDHGWNVSGIVAMGGHRIFFVRLGRDGRLQQLFLQHPPDPLD